VKLLATVAGTGMLGTTLAPGKPRLLVGITNTAAVMLLRNQPPTGERDQSPVTHPARPFLACTDLARAFGNDLAARVVLIEPHGPLAARSSRDLHHLPTPDIPDAR